MEAIDGKAVLATLSPDLTNTPMAQEHRRLCAKAAARLLGSYRTGEANDPEVYMSGVVAVLTRYDANVVREVSDLATGLPSRLKWLPTLAEIREACEDALQPWIERKRRETAIAKQLAERDEIEAKSEEENIEYRRAVVDRLWPRAAEGIGPKRVIKDDLKFKPYSDEELLGFYRKDEAEADDNGM